MINNTMTTQHSYFLDGDKMPLAKIANILCMTKDAVVKNVAQCEERGKLFYKDWCAVRRETN